MKKSISLLAIVLLTTSLATSYLFENAVRAWIVAPIYDLLQHINRNQSFVWVFFLTILTFIILTIIQQLAIVLRLDTLFTRFVRKKKEIDKSQLKEMGELINLNRARTYTPNSFTKILGQLFLEVVSNNQRLTPQTVLEQLKADSLEIAPDLNAYLRATLLQEYSMPPRWTRFIFWKKFPPSPLDLNPEKIIEFMEHQMHTGNYNEKYRGIDYM